MTENKRYELIWETDEMCNVFDNDLDVNSTISVEDVVDKLNEQEERIKSKERVIKAYEDYIKTLKEDGVLDD